MRNTIVGVIALLTTGYRCKIYEVEERIYYAKPEKPAEAPMFHSMSDKETEIINYLRQKEKPKPISTRTMKFEWAEISRVPTDSDYEKIFRIGKKEEEWLLKEQIKDKGFSRSARYTVLGVEDTIRWKTLIFRWVLGFSLVWAIYAFTRWVVKGFSG